MKRLQKILLFTLGAILATGQTVTRNLSDGLTPPAVAPGAPPGVKSISSLEAINLYSGSLSAVVPLLQVGGRGGAGYEIVARVGTAPWTINMETAPFCPVPNEACNGFTHSASASNRELNPYESPYSPGMVFGKRSGVSPYVCGSSGVTTYSQAFTHLVFERPDGSQVKLWDGTGPSGEGVCSSTVRNRGKIFRAIGDSQITFIATSDVVDDTQAWTADKFTVSGKLLFPDGVEYTVTSGVVTQITDRNSNFIVVHYAGTSTNPDLITDSLGRSISIEHDTNDLTYGRVDILTYNGWQGSSRKIYVERVRTGSLPLRSDLANTTLSFGGGIGIGFTNFDRMIKRIILPDARQYVFQYNAFAELARIELPSGGAIEYDHAAGLSNAGNVTGTYTGGAVLDSPGTIANTTDSNGWRPAIYRRLVARRTYPNGGSSASGTTAESTTTYSLRESASNPTTAGGKTSAITVTASPYVEESVSGTGISTAIATQHYFFETADTPLPSWALRGTASPLKSMLTSFGAVRMPNDDNVYEGVEFKTSQPGFQTSTKAFVLAADPVRALRVCQETLLAGDSANKRAETLLAYDSRGNVTETYLFGYGDGPTMTTSTNGVPPTCASVPAGNTYQKKTLVTYKNDAAYVADSRHLLRLVSTEEIFGPGAAQVAKTTYDYDGRTLLAGESTPGTHDAANYGTGRTERGNVTAVVKYKSSGAGLTTAYQYDVLGNARYMLPPNLVAAFTSYSSSATLHGASTNAGKWSYGTACGSAFVTGETLPGANDSTTRFSTSAAYDCWIGQPTTFVDINGVSTTFDYGSTGANMDKLVLVKRAAGSGVESRTSYDYGLSAGNVYVATNSSLRTAADGLLRIKSVFDGFGRETESQQHNGSAWVVTKKVYDGAHRVWKVYNPTTGTPSQFTQTAYDALGRPTTVTAPDGSKTSYSYPENTVTVTDPRSVSKTTTTDALGRISSVTEDPAGLALVTNYFYNANGNLLVVCPPGGTFTASSGACTGSVPIRTFSYDWLGRLMTASNPESSTVSYAYDETASTNGTGNLTSKSQVRGVVTTATVTTRFHYDNLGRMTSKVYSGSADGIATPSVTYSYDVHNPAISGVTSYARGRRTRVEVTGGTVTAVDSFDEMGRATRTRQVTGGTTYRFGSDAVAGYEYLRNGAVGVMRLPTGRTLNYTFDDAGRPVGVGDGATTYVSAVSYKDHGAIGAIRMNGQMLRETRTYDTQRLQMTGIALEKCTDLTVACSAPSPVREFGYTFQSSATGGNGGGPNNSGNVLTQTITDDGVLRATQSYGYDALDRLTTFTEGALSETNCYDAHGNRAVAQTAGLPPYIPQVTSCTASAVSTLFPGNRWSGMGYDAAGGIGNDGRVNLRYDGEDRLVKTWPTNGVETQYGYDGDGKRVTAGASVFVYDGFGKMAVEYGAAVGATSTDFVGVDHLGTTRAVVGKDGGIARRLDYRPFGMELSSADTGWRTAGLGFGVDGRARVKFTGQVRDEGTGLDYFGARYYSGAMGRFGTADVPFADQHPSDPQSWSLYSYVRNSPLRNTDPTGHCLYTGADCFQYLIGGAKAVANIPSNTATLINRGINTLTGSNIPDAPRLEGANYDQQAGMDAANAVMLVSPLVELGAAKAVGATVASTEEVLTNAATKAVDSIGPGSGRVYGTVVHSEFERNVNALGRADLFTEVSYKSGKVVPRGTAGSIRADVVEGSPTSPKAVYDLKTGTAGLTQRRTQQIQNQLPRKVPVKEIRPGN